MVKTLICTMGLPRSGKSTWARNQPFPVISPDAVRLALHGKRHWPPGETMVWALLPLMVKALFEAGNDTVILDATNVTRWEREQWQSDQWETVFHFIDTDAATCAARVLITNQPDVIEAIDRKSKEFEPLEEDELRYVS